jgi:hypothetical protein
MSTLRAALNPARCSANRVFARARMERRVYLRSNTEPIAHVVAFRQSWRKSATIRAVNRARLGAVAD